jgi:hypothetical protein
VPTAIFIQTFITLRRPVPQNPATLSWIPLLSTVLLVGGRGAESLCRIRITDTLVHVFTDSILNFRQTVSFCAFSQDFS